MNTPELEAFGQHESGAVRLEEPLLVRLRLQVLLEAAEVGEGIHLRLTDGLPGRDHIAQHQIEPTVGAEVGALEHG